MRTTVVGRDVAVAMIGALENGRFFTVIFRRRSDGSVRIMHCRQGVVAHLRGGKPSYSFSDKGLVSVWDVEAQGYRCFGLDTLMAIRTDGEEYVVDQQLQQVSQPRQHTAERVA